MTEFKVAMVQLQAEECYGSGATISTEEQEREECTQNPGGSTALLALWF